MNNTKVGILRWEVISMLQEESFIGDSDVYYSPIDDLYIVELPENLGDDILLNNVIEEETIDELVEEVYFIFESLESTIDVIAYFIEDKDPKTYTEIKFNNKQTDLPIYDQMMNKPEYFEKNKGMTFEIKYIPPREYVSYLAKAFDMDVDVLIQRAKLNTESMELFDKLVAEGKAIYMPVIEYRNGDFYTNEGLHRAVYALIHGVKEIPVLYVTTERKL